MFRMNEEQFGHIWSQLAKSPDGRVDYREFLKTFSARTNISRAASATPPPSSRDGRVSTREAVRFVDMTSRAGMGGGGVVFFKPVFSRTVRKVQYRI